MMVCIMSISGLMKSVPAGKRWENAKQSRMSFTAFVSVVTVALTKQKDARKIEMTFEMHCIYVFGAFIITLYVS